MDITVGFGRENTENATNPLRGTYVIHYFTLGDPVDYEELYWCIDRYSRISFVFISLEKYRERPIDRAGISQLREILSFFYTEKRDVILRVAYDKEGLASQKEPTEFSLVETHMQSICDLLRNYRTSVFLWQGLLLGNWGELHGSSFITPTHLRTLAAIQDDALSEQNIHFAVRTPMQHRFFPEERGIFDDGFLGSENHMGAFAICPDDAEMKYMMEVSSKDYFGGETTFTEDYSVTLSTEEILSQFEMFHIAYLNKTHDERWVKRMQESVLELPNSPWNGKDLYSYIVAHLGYRLIVNSLEKTENGLVVKVCNVGFSPIFFPISFSLILEECVGEVDGKSDKATYVETLGISVSLPAISFLPGQEEILTFPMDMLESLEGDKERRLYLKCFRTSDELNIYFSNEGEQGKKGMFLGRV